ncbi:MAG TPA: response regulator [Gammaproteobacteria bacterium]|nr:response regulator [Gammaproteobacteria bacterium]
MRVLLVEDDELLGDGVRVGLMQFGYVVDWVKDGQTALQAILSETFDTIVLDLELPKRSGLEVLRAARSKNINTPVLILTARELVEDRVKGLDAGADDYLVKPFDLGELSARIRALQRRTVSRAEPMITFGEITLDPASRTAFLKEEPMILSRREFALLHKLLENVGRVLSREQLTQTLYGWGDEIDSNALEVHIHNLRKKFGHNLIRTIRGVGYVVEKAK